MSSNPDDVEPLDPREWTQEIHDYVDTELQKIQLLLKKKSEALEKLGVLDTRDESPEKAPPTALPPVLKTLSRIMSTLKCHLQAEDVILKENNNLKEQLTRQQYLLEEIEMERDVLLQQVHAYLETNSSLRVRLEEQRCQSGALQRQLNSDLKSRIKSLETDKEQLIDSNLEKDQKIQKMTLALEKTVKSLKDKETEVLTRGTEENDLMNLLKADLKRALEDKMKTEERYETLKEQVEDYFAKKNAKDRALRDRRRGRSISMGDLNTATLGVLERNILQKPKQEFLSTQELFKSPEHVEGSWKLHASRSWPNGVTSTVRDERIKATPVHSQLNSLRRDLLHVTRKLEALKFQLVTSGVIPEESKPSKESRSLKRKANPVGETGGETGGGDEHKPEFKNLKNILQDAKNLNAKLQNLREEKQKIIDSSKMEGGGQVVEKENEFSQTAHEAGPPTGVFKTR